MESGDLWCLGASSAHKKFSSALNVPNPSEPQSQLSFGAWLSTEVSLGTQKHTIHNCSLSGLAGQIGLRNGDHIVCINGMDMERCPHQVLVALLTMAEMVEDNILQLDITVIPNIVQFKTIDEEDEFFTSEIMCKTFQIRIRMDGPAGLNVQTIDKEAEFSVKKDVICAHNASTEKCLVEVLGAGNQQYLHMQDGKLSVGPLPATPNSAFCFNKTHFYGFETNPDSRYHYNNAFIMIFNTTFSDVKKYVCAGNRKAIGLLSLRSEDHLYVTHQTVHTDTDPRYFYRRSTGRGYDYFESTLQQGHFLAFIDEQLCLKYLPSPDADKIEDEDALLFFIRPWSEA